VMLRLPVSVQHLSRWWTAASAFSSPTVRTGVIDRPDLRWVCGEERTPIKQ
jgi:hypothetical protein